MSYLAAQLSQTPVLFLNVSILCGLKKITLAVTLLTPAPPPPVTFNDLPLTSHKNRHLLLMASNFNSYFQNKQNKKVKVLVKEFSFLSNT